MLLQADAYNIPLPDQSVHAVMTSSPYWGLRKYSGAQGRIWGGDSECVHEFVERKYYTMRGASSQSSEAFSEAGQSNADRLKAARWMTDSICQLCSAWYGGLGLEPTPELHIQNMVSIFREIKRVLRDDGVVWLNYGDCYAGSGGEHKDGGGQSGLGLTDRGDRVGIPGPKKFKLAQGNLMLMPHRVAIALQDDGWIVRNDLIWFKRNPMPESVAGWRWEKSRTEKSRHEGFMENKRGLGYFNEQSGSPDLVEWDYGDDYVLKKGSWRHTRAHEYIFQLVKGMNYYSNQEAVREIGTSGPSDIRKMEEQLDRIGGKHKMLNDPLSKASAATHIGKKRAVGDPSGRNPRSVLDVPTAPYKGAHYATFPPNLIAPLIRASCPRRSCPECGQAWAPVVERGERIQAHWENTQQSKINTESARGKHGATSVIETGSYQTYKTKDYRPTCSHNHDPIPGIVLDPFIGSGTTGAVARELQRRWIGLDISMDYLDQQAKVRALRWTPSKALEGLPLFEGAE